MMRIINVLSGFVGKYLTYIVFVVVAAAFARPALFTWSVPYTAWLLGFIMFGMGMTLHAADFRLVLRRPREVFLGCTCHYTIMPFVAYALTILFQLPAELAVGMVLLGASPSGTASNIMSYLAKGDVPLAVSITTMSTLIAPVMMPLLTWALAGQWVVVSFMAMLMSIVKVILFPIALGLIIHKIIGDRFIEPCSKLLVLFSASAVLLIVGAMVGINGPQILELGFMMVLVVLLHNLFGFALGYFATGKLHFGMAQRHSVTLEVGMQNSALACSLATLHFTAAVAIPAAIASALHQVTGSLLAGIFAKRMDRIEAKEAAQAINPAPATGH